MSEEIMTEDYVCRLPEDVQKYAKEVLNETEENRKEGFTKIKEWAANNPDLNVRIEDKYILPFLRVCKFNIEKTKEKMKNYYVMEKDVKEWYQNKDPEFREAQELIKMGCYLILKRNSESGLIGIVRGTLLDPNKYQLETFLKIGFIIVSMVLFEDELSQIYGCSIIADFANIKFGHIRQISYSLIKESAYMIQNIHGRPQQMVFVNFPKVMHVFLKFLTILLPEKIRRRHSSKSDNDVTDLFDKEILPPDYGGIGESTKETTGRWLKKMVDYINWFTKDTSIEQNK